MLHISNCIDIIENAFAKDVIRGLAADVKTLPSRWLYDEQGSALFEEITKLDEYYLTRAETSILRERQKDYLFMHWLNISYLGGRLGDDDD